MYTNNINYLC